MTLPYEKAKEVGRAGNPARPFYDLEERREVLCYSCPRARNSAGSMGLS